MQTVYADLYFLMNWVIDYILLYSAARLASHSAKWHRLISASFGGAVYAVIGLWDLPHTVALLYSPAGKLACSFLMILWAFAPVPRPKFIVLTVYVYTIAALVAGTSIAFSLVGTRSLIDSWTRWQGVPWWGVVAIAIVAGFYLHRLWNWANDRQMSEQQIVRVRASIGKFQFSCAGLVDTGHTLRDPVSHQPVLVVEVRALASWLPSEFVTTLHEEPLDWPTLISGLQQIGWENRLTILPFHSLGRSKGTLIGLRSDYLDVFRETSDDAIHVQHTGIIVALYPGRLDQHEQFQALLHPELIRGKSLAVRTEIGAES